MPDHFPHADILSALGGVNIDRNPQSYLDVASGVTAPPAAAPAATTMAADPTTAPAAAPSAAGLQAMAAAARTVPQGPRPGSSWAGLTPAAHTAEDTLRALIRGERIVYQGLEIYLVVAPVERDHAALMTLLGATPELRTPAGQLIPPLEAIERGLVRSVAWQTPAATPAAPQPSGADTSGAHAPAGAPATPRPHGDVPRVVFEDHHGTPRTNGRMLAGAQGAYLVIDLQDFTGTDVLIAPAGQDLRLAELPTTMNARVKLGTEWRTVGHLERHPGDRMELRITDPAALEGARASGAQSLMTFDRAVTFGRRKHA